MNGYEFIYNVLELLVGAGLIAFFLYGVYRLFRMD